MATTLNDMDLYDEDEDEQFLDTEDDTLRYFKPLMSKEQQERSSFLESTVKAFTHWSTSRDARAQHLLSFHLPTVLRLALTCPFNDVRKTFKSLLQALQDGGLVVPRPLFDGPSSFISKSEIPGYGGTKPVNDQLQILYETAFLRDTRLSHMLLTLGDHPRYLDLFIQTLDFIMYGDGPLSLDVRAYIAILAASRHKCSYLVTYQEMEFKAKGGDPDWLRGLQHIPTKIHNLLQLNKMLCHQPWYITENHFKDLLVGRDSWSVAELVHAVVIMACYHSLASYCLGCGLNPEIDTELGHVSSDQTDVKVPQCTNPALGLGGTPGSDSEPSSEPISPACSPPSSEVSKYLVEHYIENSLDPLVNDTPCDINSNSDTCNKRLADTITEKLAAVQIEEEDDDDNPELVRDRQFAESVSSFGMERVPSRSVVPTHINLSKYLIDSNYEHEDFTLTSACTLRAREYSWEDHGFSFLSSLYPQMSELLDQKFKVATEMTYRRVGQQINIDTKPFREATWYYIQSIKGIRHDDYNYGMVNKILTIQYKTYIRMVGCFPEKITKFDFLNYMDGLEFSEKIHVNVLVMEARLQAELIYVLKALMNHMK